MSVGMNTLCMIQKGKTAMSKRTHTLELGLLTAVVEQIKLDADNGDFTAIEELFLGLESAEEQLKAFLPEQGE